jgi:hypothetical protein
LEAASSRRELAASGCMAGLDDGCALAAGRERIAVISTDENFCASREEES